MTSSIRYLVVVGRTRPERRLMIIRPRPSAIRLRCAQMRARASSQAPAVNAFFGVFGGAPATAEPLGVRSGWATERLYDGFGRRLPDWAGWTRWAGWQDGPAYAAVAASARQAGSAQPNAVVRQILTEETYDAKHLVRGSLSDCRRHEVVGAETGHQGGAGRDHESGRGLQSISGRSKSRTVPVADRGRGDLRWRDTQR